MIRLILAMILLATPAIAETLRMAVTTSFHNSGLADVLLPEIKKDTGIEVQLLVVGTGQALRLGAAGDVDAVLVHSRAAEEAFIAAGHATHRREVMYNDYVIVGPEGDPAGISDAKSASAALAKIAAAEVPFISRGDDSGTHKKEQSLWTEAGLSPSGDWYRDVGAGMGAALRMATAMSAYTLSDRASWLNYRSKAEFAIAFSGGADLRNPYAFLAIDPAKHGHANFGAAMQLETWLVGARAAGLVNEYRITGQPLFVHVAD